MGERLRNLLRQICCLKLYVENAQDIYMEVAKADMDNMIMEKIKTNASIRRLEMLNEKLEWSIADIHAKLDEKEQEISKLEDIIGVGVGSDETNGAANSCDSRNIPELGGNGNNAPCMGTRVLLSKRLDRGFDLGKYLIKESNSTPSDCELSKVDDATDTNTIAEDFERDENNNIINFSNRSSIGQYVLQSNVETHSVHVIDNKNNNKSVELVIKPDNNIDTEDEENRFWFYK